MRIFNFFLPQRIKQRSIFVYVSVRFLWLMTLVGVIRSLLHIFLPDGGAQSIATIPLTSFSIEAQAVVVGMFAFWGLSQLLSSLFYVYILIAKVQWIPLAWLLVLFEYTARWLIGQWKPFETIGTAPGAIGNYVFVVLSLAMLVWYGIQHRKLIF